MNWARLMLVATVALAVYLAWAWHKYRRFVRQLDAERDAEQWTEDRL